MLTNSLRRATSWREERAGLFRFDCRAAVRISLRRLWHGAMVLPQTSATGGEILAMHRH